MDINFHYKINNKEYINNFYIKDYNLLKIDIFEDDYSLDKKQTISNINNFLKISNINNIHIENINNWECQIINKISNETNNDNIIDLILILKLCQYCDKNKIRIELGL